MEAKSGSVGELRTAIQQLVDSRKSKLATPGVGGSKSETDVSIDGGDYEMLSQLLSQLQTLEGEASIKQLLTQKDEPLGAGNDIVENQEETEKQSKGIGTEEIIEEIKNVKRQNTITHWLLSGLLVITVVWQLSEVSLMLKMKDGLEHPFKSVGSMLSGLIKRPSRNGQNGEQQSSLAPMENLVEAPSLPVQIPQMEFPGVGGSDNS